MRLAGCVLVELAVGVALLAGAGVAATEGAHRIRGFIGAAQAAEVPRERVDRPPLEYPLLPRARVAHAGGYFLGVKDEILTAPLQRSAVARVRFNHGGSSVSLRIDFADGSRAAFKPDQTDLQTVPRREIAAYRMSCLLGLEAVAPAIGRKLPMTDLVDKLDPGSRDMLERMQAEIIVGQDGMVAGELSWWIPIIINAEIDGTPIDSPAGIAAWHRYLAAGAPEPYEARHLLPQISSMVVFDYLINNSDRFSGSNAKASPDGRTLYFMDNTLSFGGILEGSPKVRAYLEKVQKFSRELVRRARSLDEDMLRAAMSDAGPYARALDDDEIAAVLHRRDRLLEYVDGLMAEHGEAEVLVYP